MARECMSCGSLSTHTAFPPPKRRAYHLCTDCVDEWPREQERRARVQLWIAYRRVRKITTRASYRAQLRWRESLPQADLVDLVVAAP